MNTEPSQTSPVATKTISYVVQWTKEVNASRLYLPTIQRSLVWRNSQIINYWDSLLRGYPAGLMMVHNPKKDALLARSAEGNTCEIRVGDFQLFDGQQRLTAILLGLGEGQLNERLKLWVDLGSETRADSDLRFVLRISSTGQPFGYQPTAPNEKFPLNKRRDKARLWMKNKELDRFISKQAFAEADGNDLIDAGCAIPLCEIIDCVQKFGAAQAAMVLLENHKDKKISVDRLESFTQALSQTLNLPILFQLIDPAVIEHEEEYIRFFGRLGQGGTALTNDELTYSIIKHHFPNVHDCMKRITGGLAGRLTSEVNLVLAALRVAKVSTPKDNSDDWQVYGRPHPAFVNRIRKEEEVLERFQSLTGGGHLEKILESIRKFLEYDEDTNPRGLPVILLARLPHQLIDVLILMESQRSQQEESSVSLPAFVLYWLLFVADSEKAANMVFRRFSLKEADWQPLSDMKLIRHFEEQGISCRLPDEELLGKTRDEVRSGSHLLRAWGDRFAVLDANKDHPSGDALRALSTHGELIRCALLWLQRKYLSDQFPDYDPTSSRDEDLPIDLDHLIPHNKFGVDWRRQQNCLSFQSPDEKENFHHLRWTVGNSLGNFRWLNASDNRGRQDGQIEETDRERDFIDDIPKWNDLIEKNVWTEKDVAAFQELIDLRSIKIYETLLCNGLNAFVPVAPQSKDNL